ncbi:M48 family metallopeptidase [Sphingomonas sp. AP4-R1]|uniref:tetratricopeptide repeat protein n=1 Tax=Sphingomonas sp. AP4-R1 TaxID=2735134 RepID=UPI001C0FCCF1|nr:tetratricopeptide repeat protein [Sphingomonas sp. AP4-R1]
MILLFLLAAAAGTSPTPLAKLPGDDTARFNACVALTKSDVPRALSEATEWAKQADNLPSRHCLGLAQGADGDWNAAAATFVRAGTAAESANDPRAVLLWTQAGNAALAGDDPQLARTAIDRALKLPGLTEVMQGEAWLDRARANVGLNDPAAARIDIDRALKLVPNDPFAWLLSATLARRQDDLERASRDISEAAKLAPDAAAVALEAGNIAIMAGADSAAKVAWERAKKLAPGDPAGQAAAAQLEELAAQADDPPKK